MMWAALGTIPAAVLCLWMAMHLTHTGWRWYHENRVLYQAHDTAVVMQWCLVGAAAATIVWAVLTAIACRPRPVTARQRADWLATPPPLEGDDGAGVRELRLPNPDVSASVGRTKPPDGDPPQP